MGRKIYQGHAKTRWLFFLQVAKLLVYSWTITTNLNENLLCSYKWSSATNKLVSFNMEPRIFLNFSSPRKHIWFIHDVRYIFPAYLRGMRRKPLTAVSSRLPIWPTWDRNQVIARSWWNMASSTEGHLSSLPVMKRETATYCPGYAYRARIR